MPDLYITALPDTAPLTWSIVSKHMRPSCSFRE